MRNQFKAKSQRSSILKRLLFPMSILLMAQTSILVGVIYFGNILQKLNQNAYDVMNERVSTRANYINNEMINRWSNVDIAVDRINLEAQELKAYQEIDFTKINDNPKDYDIFLENITPDLITLMRTNSVNGAYVILNSSDLSQEQKDGKIQDKTGLYIRDLDSRSVASSDNSDLLLENAPVALTRTLGIATDVMWNSKFQFESMSVKDYDFFYQPYQAAIENPEVLYKDLGFWSKRDLPLNDSRNSISYAVPLKLNDGTIYGVLGMEVLVSEIMKQLPNEELVSGSGGAYILGIGSEGSNEFQNVLISGDYYRYQYVLDQTMLTDAKKVKGYIVNNNRNNSSQYYACPKYITLYNSNTPFSENQWCLIGIGREKELFELSEKIRVLFMIAFGLFGVVGVSGIVLISYIVSRPITRLARNVSESNPNKPIEFKDTHITEIDDLAESIEILSKNVHNSATKFREIIEMASINIGGFEIDYKQKTLFITDRFFGVFGEIEIETAGMGIDKFQLQMNRLKPYIIEKNVIKENEEKVIYQISENNKTIWVRLKSIQDGKRWIGLAEDVTKSTLEMQKIQYERDYDVLTNLLNRRAFKQVMDNLFKTHHETIKIGALLMFDLDNLKYLNDTYGHDFGDEYIKCAANIVQAAVPESAIVSRRSGDEFLVFLYGYESKDELEKKIKELWLAIGRQNLLLPDLSNYKLRASGGIAWYPDDSASYEKLIQYADFAMYTVKNSIKGTVKGFDINIYNREAFLLQCKEELNQLLDKEMVTYHFQPIFDGKTGSIYAYEAFMRSEMPNLKSPWEVLTLAKKEYKLYKIEYLTLFKAMDTYVSFVLQGTIDKECKIFINSIPNQYLNPKDMERFENKYSEYLENLVIEITEEEKINKDIQEQKVEKIRSWKAQLALDDFGSGYNSETILIYMKPDYVKIDLGIIRDIDKDLNKQQIVNNLVAYAHERNMKLIAEGIETKEEAVTVLRMGIDYLQGYYFGVPKETIPYEKDYSSRLVLEIQEKLNEENN